MVGTNLTGLPVLRERMSAANIEFVIAFDPK
jgi:hypothetical protein